MSLRIEALPTEHDNLVADLDNPKWIRSHPPPEAGQGTDNTPDITTNLASPALVEDHNLCPDKTTTRPVYVTRPFSVCHLLSLCITTPYPLSLDRFPSISITLSYSLFLSYSLSVCLALFYPFFFGYFHSVCPTFSHPFSFTFSHPFFLSYFLSVCLTLPLSLSPRLCHHQAITSHISQCCVTCLLCITNNRPTSNAACIVSLSYRSPLPPQHLHPRLVRQPSN